MRWWSLRPPSILFSGSGSPPQPGIGSFIPPHACLRSRSVSFGDTSSTGGSGAAEHRPSRAQERLAELLTRLFFFFVGDRMGQNYTFVYNTCFSVA